VLEKASRSGTAVRRRINAERAEAVKACVAELPVGDAEVFESALVALEALAAKSECPRG